MPRFGEEISFTIVVAVVICRRKRRRGIALCTVTSNGIVAQQIPRTRSNSYAPKNRRTEDNFNTPHMTIIYKEEVADETFQLSRRLPGVTYFFLWISCASNFSKATLKISRAWLNQRHMIARDYAVRVGCSTSLTSSSDTTWSHLSCFARSIRPQTVNGTQISNKALKSRL